MTIQVLKGTLTEENKNIIKITLEAGLNASMCKNGNVYELRKLKGGTMKVVINKNQSNTSIIALK